MFACNDLCNDVNSVKYGQTSIAKALQSDNALLHKGYDYICRYDYICPSSAGVTKRGRLKRVNHLHFVYLDHNSWGVSFHTVRMMTENMDTDQNPLQYSTLYATFIMTVQIRRPFCRQGHYTASIRL